MHLLDRKRPGTEFTAIRLRVGFLVLLAVAFEGESSFAEPAFVRQDSVPVDERTGSNADTQSPQVMT